MSGTNESEQLGELEISNYQTQSQKKNTEGGADYLHLAPLNQGDNKFMKGQRTFPQWKLRWEGWRGGVCHPAGAARAGTMLPPADVPSFPDILLQGFPACR